MKNKSSIIGTYKGKCCDYSTFNNNTMKLNAELFTNLFESAEYKRGMKYGHYIGFLGHPEDPGCMDFKNACIVMKECHLEDNGDVYGEFDLVDTPVGKVVKAFMDAGVTFGISIRGAGDIDGEGNVDPETFVFRGFDLVAFPAYDDAIPEFQEIAASSDLDKQVKYKKVCNVVKNNLSAITSASTLGTLKEQFKPGTTEYDEIESRENELVGDVEASNNIAQLKLHSVTELYADSIAQNELLASELLAAKKELKQVKASSQRKIKSMQRIAASQINDLSVELDNITGSYKTSIAANSRLKSELSKVSKDNLKYTHKIESSTETIREKDLTISKLKSELRETVTASKDIKSRASNLDVTVEDLKSSVEASDKLLASYQEAYANMYANALGVHLTDLAITSSTTVKQIRELVNAGTSTSGMMAAPSVDEELLPESIDLVDVESEEDDMVTL